jgi:ribosomal protein L37AE/L43A
MSFIQQQVELKYCERCGTLGLRRQESERIYCEPCRQEMQEVYRAPSCQRPKSASESAQPRAAASSRHANALPPAGGLA